MKKRKFFKNEKSKFSLKKKEIFYSKMAEENPSEKMNITNRKVESNDENAINVLKENHTNNSMEQMLKENLSCEIFHFILNVFYSPHII